LRQCAQAWALIDGRNFVTPEDVQAVLPSVVAHRLAQESDVAKQILEQVAIP
jgi:MoxR-like ATPase